MGDSGKERRDSGARDTTTGAARDRTTGAAHDEVRDELRDDELEGVDGGLDFGSPEPLSRGLMGSPNQGGATAR